MSALLQLYLVRHGETAWSLSGQHTGRTDLALTLHGGEQALLLKPRLHTVAFDQVLVSPRLRARQTCELAGLGAQSQTEPDLAEWDYGDYEGRSSIDIRKEHPDWNIWRDGCPNGESTGDLSARVDRLIARLAAMSGNVALFAHGQLGAALAARWIGLPLLAGQHFALHRQDVQVLAFRVFHQ